MYNNQCPPNTVLYTVQQGDTYYSIAQKFNTTIPALVGANPLVDFNNLIIGSTICVPQQQIYPSCPEGNYYTIKQGDTLNAIANFFNISLADLIEANPGINPKNLLVGQVICVPLAVPPARCPTGSMEYVINKGDTFFQLALRYNTTVKKIMELNPGVNPGALLIGQKICLPASQ